MKKILAGCLLMLAFTVSGRANPFTFATPTGATESGGGAVKASALVVTGAGTVTITLTNLLVNPKDVAQGITDFDFVLSTGATTGTLASSSTQAITVNTTAVGGYVLGSTGSTGWVLDNNIGGGLRLNGIGNGNAGFGIIGAPDATNAYSNANGSIAGNGPHNPFANQTATFVVDVTGVTAATNITSAVFSFGTTLGDNVTGNCTAGCTPSVPEPTSLLLLGAGLMGLAMVGRRFVKN